MQCVFAEMDGMGLQSPTQMELQRSLEEWNRYCKKNADALYAEELEV